MSRIARVDPGFAKSQLLLLLREWYMHPNGQIPAYEWAFGDVNPPVHAWAALKVFEIDGGRDYDFLARVMHKLLLNFTWWVNRKDVGGNNVFEGGFLGLDNVGPFDRSAALPVAGVLEQSDGTGWMAMYALNLLDMSIRLALHDRSYEDMATKFFEHFAYIAEAAYRQGLWDDEDCFFYDVLRLPDGHKLPLKARSIVGLLPLAATTRLTAGTLNRLPELAARLRWMLANQREYGEVISARRIGADGRQQRLLVAGRAGPAATHPGADARPRGVPFAVRPADALPRRTWRSRSPCRWAARTSPSGTSPPRAPAACSAATRTGAVRSGCRSTTCWSRRCASSPRSSATTCWSSTRPARRPR